MDIRYGINSIKRKLIDNFKKITHSSGYAKAIHLMKRATLLRVYEIHQALQVIRENNDGNWIATDDLGSGYDKRHIGISWMDTR